MIHTQLDVHSEKKNTRNIQLLQAVSDTMCNSFLKHIMLTFDCSVMITMEIWTERIPHLSEWFRHRI